MNMHTIDWLIIGAMLAVLLVAAAATIRYTRSVSAFLAAERCGRRYLIAMALAMAGTGVTTLVYWFQIYYEAGFSGYWWSSLTEPVGLGRLPFSADARIDAGAVFRDALQP
jgi:solute:Na+ symporter, SSS family